jgi:hypothetical protein
MSLFSLLAVLLLEQVRPLPYDRVVNEPLTHLAGFLESRLNAGERRHAISAWLIGVGGLLLVTATVSSLPGHTEPPARLVMECSGALYDYGLASTECPLYRYSKGTSHRRRAPGAPASRGVARPGS